MEAAFKLEHLSFKYKKSSRAILSDITCEIPKGEITGIMGPSGAGKTTLIRLLNGVISLEDHKGAEGDIFLLGKKLRDMPKHHVFLNVGTVLQDPDTQIIFTNVEDELAFGMENYCIEPQLIERKITEIVGLLGIEALRHRDPNTLSGGEKQLVILAAILCLDVEIIILDECMSQVDQSGRKRILALIQKLQNQGKTILMIEHEIENLSLASSILYLSEGRLSCRS